MTRPPPINRAILQRAAVQVAAASSKEANRFVADSRGGETPKQLPTYRTDIYTYFTSDDGESKLLFSAPNWVRVKLTLETAGPVAVGTSQSIAPVLGGKGVLLDTDQPFEANLPLGTRLFIISESVNRVNIVVEPIPWLEQLDQDGQANTLSIQRAIADGVRAIVGAIAQLRGPAPAASSSGLGVRDLPPPVGLRNLVPRLTRMVPAKKTR